MAKHDKAYDQVAHPSAGGTQKPGTDSANCDDAFGHPTRAARNATTVATCKPESHVKELREKQLGENGYQGN